MNVTPFGSVPLSLILGVGVPVVLTVNDPFAATVNVVLPALVIAGGTSIVTVSVLEDVLAAPAPLAETWFVTGPVAVEATFTLIVNCG
jgi:hypothetical protein